MNHSYAALEMNRKRKATSASPVWGSIFQIVWTIFLELSELVMYFSSDGILGFLFEVVFGFSSEQLFSMLPLILDLVSFGESYSLITFKEHNCLLFEKS